MYLMICAAFALAASDSPPGPAAGSQVSGQQALALLAKMKESRDRLRCGIYKATGRLLTNKRSMGQQQPEGTIEIFAAFELDKGLFRFDRTEPARVPIGGAAILDREIRKYVRTPEHTITWLSPMERDGRSRMTAVGIHQPTMKPPFGPSPFDVRSLGLGLWDDFRSGTTFDDCYEAWAKSSLVEVFPEANGVYRLRLERSGRRGTYLPQTTWLDERQGFSPVRLSYNIPASEPGHPEQVVSECQVRWQNQQGVWVPVSCRLERRLRGNLNDFGTFAFDWISVNKPVPPETFTPEGLGVPEGTPVLDFRAAPPRPVGEVPKIAVPR